MGVSYGRYAPFGHSHPEEQVLTPYEKEDFMATGKFLLNHRGVKIGLS